MAWAIVAGAAVSVVGGSLLADDYGAEEANEAVADATDLQAQISKDQWNRYKQIYEPLERQLVNAGDSLVAIRNGEATPVYTAPESSKSAAAKQGPLERDVAYLVAQHGMSKEQALAHLSAAKTMSREQFILQGMRDSMDPARSKADLAAELGALYDSIQGKRAAPAASNSSAPSTVHADPQLLELLSIPSTP